MCIWNAMKWRNVLKGISFSHQAKDILKDTLKIHKNNKSVVSCDNTTIFIWNSIKLV